MWNKIKKYWSQFINYTKNNIILVGTTFLVMSCIVAYLLILKYGKGEARNFTERKQYLVIKDTTINSIKTAYIYDKWFKITTIIHPNKYKDTYNFTRTISQLQIIKQRTASHNRVIDYFIINMYYFIIIQILFGIVACIMAVIISKKGWADSNPKIIATFLIIVGLLLFFQLIPKGMKFDDNLATNKAHYLAYCDLENRINTYLSDSTVIPKYNKRIDKLLKTYHSISFDLQQIPFSEIQKQFEEITSVAEGEKLEIKEPANDKRDKIPDYSWRNTRDERNDRDDSLKSKKLDIILTKINVVDSLQRGGNNTDTLVK